jgi:hypothetical protein
MIIVKYNSINNSNLSFILFIAIKISNLNLHIRNQKETTDDQKCIFFIELRK